MYRRIARLRFGVEYKICCQLRRGQQARFSHQNPL